MTCQLDRKSEDSPVISDDNSSTSSVIADHGYYKGRYAERVGIDSSYENTDWDQERRF
ncbi:hypothetical protein SK128_001626, partial [Halocaridina rubra]